MAIGNLTRFWNLLSDKIKEKRAERLDWMAAGRLSSYDAYRQEVGFLNALAWLEGTAAELFEPAKPTAARDEGDE